MRGEELGATTNMPVTCGGGLYFPKLLPFLGGRWTVLQAKRAKRGRRDKKEGGARRRGRRATALDSNIRVDGDTEGKSAQTSKSHWPPAPAKRAANTFPPI